MRILAIETSCDETGLAIVDTENAENTVTVNVRAEALLSQALLHAEYGGVYPSLAKREHAKNLVPLLTEVLKKAGLFSPTDTPETSKETIGELKEILEREPETFIQLALLLSQTDKPNIDAIAVTHGPGLEPALWVGVNFAKSLAHAWGVPILPINHMEGHVAAALAQEKDGNFTVTHPQLPALILLISGGHTELVLMKDWLVYEKIGTTRDDAAGEAFDKSARLLGIPYPGGPEISKQAAHARTENLEQPYSLPRPMLDTNDYDFSFSGLKTAVRNLVESVGEPNDEQKKQIAREVEDAITDVLVHKTKRAIDEYGARSIIVSGGVSANTYIKKGLENVVHEYENMHLYIPTPSLATDNGIMIALAAALHTNEKNTIHSNDIRVESNLPLY